MMALRSHILVAAKFGPYGDERPYARELWSELPDNSLAIVDRNFLAANILIPIETVGKNRHWLTRASKRTTWSVIKKLGDGDALVEIEVSRHARAKIAICRARGNSVRSGIVVRDFSLRHCSHPLSMRNDFPRAVKIKMSSYNRKRPTTVRKARRK